MNLLKTFDSYRDTKAYLKREKDLSGAFDGFRALLPKYVSAMLEKSPAYRAEASLLISISHLKTARSKMEIAEKRMSWWKKLTQDPPNFGKIDQRITRLESALNMLRQSGDLEKTNTYFKSIEHQAKNRIKRLEERATLAIPASRKVPFDGNETAKTALWFSAMSIPVSAWSDVGRAGDIYETLRSVNSNYANMSDTDIWLESLTLPTESLTGLISLAKGAYFEKLVADQTNGLLFSQFNHPDTDIIIDDVAYQLKATDSEAYVNTVSDDIPVISTTEISDITGSIDSGITNFELEQATELALDRNSVV